MNKIQDQLPELWEKLHPPGQFEHYFAQAAELRANAARLSPEERWSRAFEISGSEEGKAYMNLQAKVFQEYMLQGKGDVIQAYLRLMKEENRQNAALYHPADAPPVSYAKEIAGYVTQIIGLYCDALPDAVLQKVKLRFDVSKPEDEYDENDEIQPTIEMTYDAGLRAVHPGLLWDETLELERDGRKNAQIWAESVWPEFRESASAEDVAKAAEQARDIVAKEFPGIPVDCEIVP